MGSSISCNATMARRTTAISPSRGRAPAEELAVLQEEADDALKAGKTLKEWLDGAIALRYCERAAQARADAGKDTGTVRFADCAVTVVADLPKKVEWDQRQLAVLVERIRASGENSADYVSIEFTVSERAYGAWPESIRKAFAPARTVRTGKPAFRLLLSLKGNLMFLTSKLAVVRKHLFGLTSLPDTIRIPAIGDRPETLAKPIETATLDDLAFAMRVLDAEFSAVGDRLHALRKLYTLARDTGAFGSDCAIDVVATAKRER